MHAATHVLTVSHKQRCPPHVGTAAPHPGLAACVELVQSDMAHCRQNLQAHRNDSCIWAQRYIAAQKPMATLRRCRRCPSCFGLRLSDGMIAEHRRWNDICAAHLLCGRVYPGHDPEVHLLSLLRIHRRRNVRSHVVQADWWHLGTQLCSQQQVHHPDTCTSVTKRAAGCSCALARQSETQPASLLNATTCCVAGVQAMRAKRGATIPCSSFCMLDNLPGSMAHKAVHCD